MLRKLVQSSVSTDCEFLVFTKFTDWIYAQLCETIFTTVRCRCGHLTVFRLSTWFKNLNPVLLLPRRISNKLQILLKLNFRAFGVITKIRKYNRLQVIGAFVYTFLVLNSYWSTSFSLLSEELYKSLKSVNTTSYLLSRSLARHSNHIFPDFPGSSLIPADQHCPRSLLAFHVPIL